MQNQFNIFGTPSKIYINGKSVLNKEECLATLDFQKANYLISLINGIVKLYVVSV